MTALPTDFSVTSALGRPTTSPEWPLNKPAAADSVDVPLFDGAGLVTSVDVPSIDSATTYTAESVAILDAPSTATPESAANIDLPSAASAQAQPSIDLPSTASAASEPVIDTPNIVTANTGTATTPPFPLNHARILYDNLLLNYSGVSVNSGTNGSYALIPNTYKGWEFTHDGSSTFSWIVEIPSNVDMDTFCIGAHNISSISGTVEVFYDTDATIGGFISVGTSTPSNDTPIMMHLPSTVSVRRVQISITSSVAGYVKIGYISAGIALQLQRPFFSGHTPITMGDNTVYRNNMTDGGEFTSRSIIRKGFGNSVSLDNVDRTWIQDYFLDFKEVSKEYLYFIAWNLLEYPKEVGLCMTSGDISLQFSGTRDLMSINWSQTGHGSV